MPEPSVNRRSLFRACLHFVGRPVLFSVALLLMLLIAVYTWLACVGFPQAALDRVLRGVRSRGIRVDADRLRLNSINSVAVDSVRIFESADAAHPVAEASHIVLGWSLLDWTGGHPRLDQISLESGRIQIEVQSASGTGAPPAVVRVDRMAAMYKADDSGADWVRFRASCLGIDVSGDARLGRTDAGPKPRSDTRAPAPAARTVPMDALRHAPDWIPVLVRELATVRFARPPEAYVRLNLDPSDPARTEAIVSIRGFGTLKGDVALEEWSVAGRWDRGLINVLSAHVRQGKESIHGWGWADVRHGTTEAHVIGRINPAHWMDVLPPRLRDVLGRQRIDLRGAVEFDVAVGPCAFAEATNRTSGRISVEKGSVRGLAVENAKASFEFHGPRVELTDVRGVLGDGEGRGAVRGAVTYDFSSQQYEARVEAMINPHVVIDRFIDGPSYLPPIDLYGSPPRIELVVRGRPGHEEAFSFRCHAQAADFAYNDVPIAYFDSVITVSNHVLRLDPLFMVRDEGKAEGWVRADFGNRLVDLDVYSSASPYAIARIAAPAAEQMALQFRFEGPTYATVNGTIDYGSNLLTDVEAQIEGERIGFAWLAADRASFTLRAKGHRLYVDEMEGAWCGGRVNGGAALSNIGVRGANVAYSVIAAAENVDLMQVAALFSRETAALYEGRLSASAFAEGLAGAGMAHTATGSGQVAIEKGNLLQIPVLGGLSKSLSRLYPGLGYTYQRNFRANYQLKDGRIRTEDAELQGRLLSIYAKGDYHLDQRLSFRVSFKPLQEGIVAEAIRLVISPATKLFEFDLGGTVAAPEWHIVNLPKELLGFFSDLTNGRSGE